MPPSNKSWPLPLVINQTNVPSSYKPRNDFVINSRGLPVLLLEVTSDSGGETDRNRMLLQGSCIVRLGESLLKANSPKFLVKAIYIDDNFCADEYTLFTREILTDVIVPFIAE